jgi:DNA polymerase beta
MNSKIIEEFERLISFTKDQQINAIDKKAITANQFRIKQLQNILSILKKYPENITIDNYKELSKISGIGKGSIDRIKEILEKGSLLELENYKDVNKKKKEALEDLESVVGIGPTIALELYDQGIKSVKKLKKMVEKNEIEVNDKILLGLKYYGKFEGNIPRKEITCVNKILIDVIKKLNKDIDEDKKYVFEICGSYRREKPTSGDIDVLISKKGKLNEKVNYLEKIIDLLNKPIKKNNDKPLLIDALTDKNIHTKYMGFCKYLDNPNRRIDIRFVPFDSFFSALAYFTGSADLNKKMRTIAKNKKLKLSEYGLFKQNGEKLPIHSEQDIYDILGMEFIEPKYR